MSPGFGVRTWSQDLDLSCGLGGRPAGPSLGFNLVSFGTSEFSDVL